MAAYRRVCGGFCGALQSFESLEKHLLDGQKLQGPPTAADVYRYLELRAADDGYRPTYRPHHPAVAQRSIVMIVSVCQYPQLRAADDEYSVLHLLPFSSTQPCIPRVPSSAGVRAGMSRLPGGR